MYKLVSKFESILIYTFSLILPIIILPINSEIFEFNKIVAMYLVSSLLGGIWLFKILSSKSFREKANSRIATYKYYIFPVVLYLTSQIVSLYFSIDRNTSLFGYYGRFNGGVLHVLSLTILFLVIFTWIDNYKIKRLVNFLIASTFFIALIGFFEHFGFGITCGYAYLFGDKPIDSSSYDLLNIFSTNCWFQDVKFRVFSTFGQPNWFATWIVVIIPLIWYRIYSSKSYKYLLSILGLLISVVVFTQSRSGFIALLFSLSLMLLYVVKSLIVQKKNGLRVQILKVKTCQIIFIFLLVLGVFGSPWTKSIESIYRENSEIFVNQRVETTGIRKLLWSESIDILQKYPLFGSGPETFAYEFTKVRDKRHNETFEWDYLYNKAHNEYLNQFANSGLFGGLAYILINLSLIALIFRNKSKFAKKHWDFSLKNLLMFASFFGLIITNFFGFSVTANSYLFYLIPLLSLNFKNYKSSDNDLSQKWILILSLITVLLVVSSLMFLISRYWLADFYFARSIKSERVSDYENARYFALNSIQYRSDEAIYWMKLAEIESRIAESSANLSDDLINLMVKNSVTHSEIAIELNPHDVVLYKDYASNLIRLNNFSPGYMQKASEVLTQAISLSPTDPKLVYNLALTYIRSGKENKGIDSLETAIILKNDYYDPYFARAVYYYQIGSYDKSRSDLKVILNNISPGDKDAIDLLEKMEK